MPRKERIDKGSERLPYKGKHCFRCERLPWRRQRPRCPACGEPYGEDLELFATRPRAREVA